MNLSTMDRPCRSVVWETLISSPTMSTTLPPLDFMVFHYFFPKLVWIHSTLSIFWTRVGEFREYSIPSSPFSISNDDFFIWAGWFNPEMNAFNASHESPRDMHLWLIFTSRQAISKDPNVIGRQGYMMISWQLTDKGPSNPTYACVSSLHAWNDVHYGVTSGMRKYLILTGDRQNSLRVDRCNISNF